MIFRTLLPTLLLVPALYACGSADERPEEARHPDPVETIAAEPAGVPEVPEPAEVAEVEPEEEAPFPYELIEGEPMYTVVPKDGIPAIDEPVFVSAADAAAFMRDDETVLGVVGREGSAKCYSAWQLDGHEIVNDVLDDVPIAATW